MKFFKLFFSKILVVFLLFVLQLAIIFAAVLLLENFIFFQIASFIISLIIFFYIINKKEPPEFKIPWLVLMFLFPFFTIMVYILFANVKVPKRTANRLKGVHNAIKPYVEENNRDFSDYLGGYCGIHNYLLKNSYLPGHTDNRVTYFKSGEEFWQDLLAELGKAEKYIFMEYFIIAEGKMWNGIHDILVQKVKEGVEVRIIYDDIGSVGKTRVGFCKKLKKEGINIRKFNPFRPIISGIHNNRDHRKITVIDGKVGYTGGVNIGDEYINYDKPLGHWKDTAIKIEGSAVDNLLAMFLQLFDSSAKTVGADYGKYFLTEHEKFEGGGFVQPFGDGPKPFYGELIGEDNYINLINASQKYCYITTPYLIPDYTLISALRNAAYRGVDVRIITPHIPDKKVIFNMTRSNFPYLLKAGVKIYEYTPGFVHAKMLVADDSLAFVGTVNLDYRSFVHHYECGAFLCKTPCIADIKEDFDDVIDSSHEVTIRNFKMGKAASFFNSLLNMFSPMM